MCSVLQREYRVKNFFQRRAYNRKALFNCASRGLLNISAGTNASPCKSMSRNSVTVRHYRVRWKFPASSFGDEILNFTPRSSTRECRIISIAVASAGAFIKHVQPAANCHTRMTEFGSSRPSIYYACLFSVRWRALLSFSLFCSLSFSLSSL